MRKIDPNDFKLATRGTSREINRQIALTLVRTHQPVSRADLARLMETNRANITLLVNELLEEKLVREGAQANRQVRFKFLFTPFQLWQFWYNAAKGRALKVELAMIDALINEPNVEIHDLTRMVWFTHNPDRYDYIHYDLEGAREVVDALASGSMRVTSTARHREMLLNEIQAGGEMVQRTVEEFKTGCP